MKTIITPSQIKNFIFCAFLLLSAITGFCQPDYKFTRARLIAGTDRQIGAKYRFSNVRPGIDGIITITDLRRISLDNIDGGSGYDDAFQPILVVPTKTKGYAEFQLDFVTTGTNTLRVMTEVPLTAIDIDGFLYNEGNVYEYDEFKLTPSHYVRYDLLGTSLNTKFTGNWVQASNTTAVDCAGVDTLAKNVMFTIVHASISSTTFRVGANNENTTRGVTRLRSVYFKKFAYPSGAVLSQAPVNTIAPKNNKSNAGVKLAIYPNLIKDRASVKVNSQIAERSTLQVVDYSGKLVYNQAVQLTKGANSFNLDLAGKIARGNYIVVLSLNGKPVTEKIIVQ